MYNTLYLYVNTYISILYVLHIIHVKLYIHTGNTFFCISMYIMGMYIEEYTSIIPYMCVHIYIF